MASGRLMAVIHQLLQFVAARPGGALTDGQLLERFARRRDEAAFETLVWRHGPMVLRTCQRILGHRQDAEDAFQATFLVLCRKAVSIRSREGAGAWIYKVAYRIALRARADAARRVAAAVRVADVAAPPSAPEAELAELRPVLDDELNRLPEKYRAPLVLHYLEGKTVGQVARELGCPEGTVCGRLARARTLLRSRLSRRGVAPAGAFPPDAAVDSLLTSCVPPALLDSTLGATAAFGAGTPTAAGAAAVRLAQATLRGMLLTKLKIAAAVLVVVGTGALGVGLLARGARTNQPPAADEAGGDAAEAPRVEQPPAQEAVAAPAPAPASDAPRRLSASGRVVDADGWSVADAEVCLRAWAAVQGDGSCNGPAAADVFATTRTDAEGGFAFKDVAAPDFAAARDPRCHPWDVVVRAPGRAVAWRHLTPAVSQPLTLRIATEARIEGRLVGPGGRPAAGARVRVLDVAPLGEASLSPYTFPEGALNLYGSQIALTATADADGRFVLGGLPPERRIGLRISAEGCVEQTVYAATTAEAQPDVIDLTGGAGPAAPRVEPVRTGPLDVALRPARRWRGRVLYADTGRPAAGAVVTVRAAGASSLGATAGDDGRFTVAGIPLDACSAFACDSRNDSDYLYLQWPFDPADAPGDGEQTIHLPRGLPVAGRVVDEETGQGIAGVDVTCQATVVVRRAMIVGANKVVTDARGAFRAVVPPGEATLTAHAESCGYPEPVGRTADVKPDETPPELAFALRRGLTLAGRILDAGGSAVQGARVELEAANDPGRRVGPRFSDAEGKVVWSGLRTDLDYAWVVTHAGRKLGARLVTPRPRDAKAPAAVEVRLEPLGAVAGCVVDEDGRPLAGVALRVRALAALPDGGRKDVEGPPEELTTDADGRYRWDQLLASTECRYVLEASAEGRVGLRSAEFGADPARTTTLPDLVLLPAGERVAGVVVGPDGRPLADARLQARPLRKDPGGGDYSGPPPAVTTIDGRFRIMGLSRGPVEIVAELLAAGDPGAAARPILAATVTADAGQSDLRIVLNPAKQGP